MVTVLLAAGAIEVLLGVAGALTAPKPERREEGAEAEEPETPPYRTEIPVDECDAMAGEA